MDLRGGGTWLGVTNSGKVAALTNLPSIEKTPEKTKSRGLLIKNFLPKTLHLMTTLTSLKNQKMSFWVLI